MEKIEEKIFHGINTSNYKKQIKDIDIFESILKYGAILTRKDLKDQEYEYMDYLPNLYSQTSQEVCLAIHPKATSFYEENDIGDAFYKFVRFHLSFIFDSSMLNKVKFDTAYGMAGEIRVKGSIKLEENLIAVGYFDEIMFVLEKMRNPKTNYQLSPFYESLISYDNPRVYIEAKKEKFYFIKKLLKDYKMNVPIVDPFTGKLVNDNPNVDLEEINKALRRKK